MFVLQISSAQRRISSFDEDPKTIYDQLNQYYGEKVPNIKLYNSEMEYLYDIDSEVIILDFWSTYCSSCMRIIPDALQHYVELKEIGITNFEWINVSEEGDSTRWKDVIHSRAFAGLQCLVTREISAVDFHIQKVPTYIILDREKRIIGFDVGGPPPAAKDKGVVTSTRLTYFICKAIEGKSVAESYLDIVLREDERHEEYRQWRKKYFNLSIQKASL